MDNQELRDLLERTHAEIENTQSIDPEGQALLRHVDADIRELLDRSEDAQVQAHPDMLDRIEASVDYFEVTHPTLTTALSKLLDTLSLSGI